MAGVRAGTGVVLLTVAAITSAAALAGCSSTGHPMHAPPTPSVAAASAGTLSVSPTPPRSAGAPTTASPRASGLLVSAGSPCGSSAAPVPIRHVVLVVLENKDYGSVIGSAPYLTSLAHRCGLETDYHAITHPSLPNYLAFTSGSTHGVSDDGGPFQHPIPGPSIFSVVAAAGLSWRTFAESMPGSCTLVPAGPYAVKHNPAAYYTGLRSQCRIADVPLGDIASGPLVTELAHGSLAALTVVIPNLCDDMHDCSVGQGDRWLARWLPRIFASATYRTGTTAVFVTWDEGSAGQVVPLIVAAASVPADTRVPTPANHYSLLHTMAAALALSSASLGSAASATSLLTAFRLRPR